MRGSDQETLGKHGYAFFYHKGHLGLSFYLILCETQENNANSQYSQHFPLLQRFYSQCHRWYQINPKLHHVLNK